MKDGPHKVKGSPTNKRNRPDVMSKDTSVDGTKGSGPSFKQHVKYSPWKGWS